MTSEDPFYTETMARIHVQQGNWRRAVKIYRFLVEQDPDRRDLDAARIEAERRALESMERDLVPLFQRWLELCEGSRRLRRLAQIARRRR